MSEAAQSQYSSLAELRGELTEPDPDRRAAAYQAVLEADHQPSEVLGDDPPSESLAESGVIPTGSDSDHLGAAEARQRTIELLEDIKEAL